MQPELGRLGIVALAGAMFIYGGSSCRSSKTGPDSLDAAPIPAQAATAPAAASSAANAVAIEAFCQKAFGASLDSVLKNCTDEERQDTVVKNAAEFAQEPLRECRRLSLAVADGRVTFDAVAAAACLTSVTAIKRVDGTWGELTVPDLDESRACDSVFAGHQREGEECASTLDCQEPFTCLGAADGKADGKCRPVPTHARDSCDTVFLRVTDFKHRRRCAEGLECDPVEDVCKAATPVGGPCEHSFECVPPAACRAGKCSPLPPADAEGACEDDTDDCKPGLYCKRKNGGADEGRARKPGVCAEKKAAGAACTQELFECKGTCKRTSEHGEGTCVSRCGSG
jgi:hypothetical protein